MTRYYEVTMSNPVAQALGSALGAFARPLTMSVESALLERVLRYAREEGFTYVKVEEM